jgi:predicted acylesterase/phospholipase RssA
MVIKNLVFSGGGPSIFSIFGCVKYLNTKEIWKIDDIETIYGTSSGAFLSICICLIKLGLTFEELETYIIKRCWKTLYSQNILDFKSAFESKGLFDETVIKKAITPLLQTVELNSNTSLKELFDKTNIKFVAFSVNINVKPLEKIEISHETYPELPIYKALLMTMALPGIVTPIFMDELCLIDGGLMCNYPYYECQTDTKATDSEILGFKIKWENRKLPIDSSSNLITFISHLMRMMALHIDDITNIVPTTANTIECLTPNIGGPSKWLDVFTDIDMRNSYLECGIVCAKNYIINLEEKNLQIQQECHT